MISAQTLGEHKAQLRDIERAAHVLSKAASAAYRAPQDSDKADALDGALNDLREALAPVYEPHEPAMRIEVTADEAIMKKAIAKAFRSATHTVGLLVADALPGLRKDKRQQDSVDALTAIVAEFAPDALPESET